jgi:hypothetical protein
MVRLLEMWRDEFGRNVGVTEENAEIRIVGSRGRISAF